LREIGLTAHCPICGAVQEIKAQETSIDGFVNGLFGGGIKNLSYSASFECYKCHSVNMATVTFTGERRSVGVKNEAADSY
jgi:transcription elongation factor Elf1